MTQSRKERNHLIIQEFRAHGGSVVEFAVPSLAAVPPGKSVPAPALVGVLAALLGRTENLL